MGLHNTMIMKPVKTIRRLVFGTSCVIALHVGSVLSHEDAEQAGKVDFQISCGEESQSAMNRGMAQLHNMMYVEAEEIFKTAAGKDPGCAMLYWGIAMTRFHPLWPGRPSEEDMAVGTNAIQKAQAIGGGSERENDFIAAASKIYLLGESANWDERITIWSKAQREVHHRYPDDVDAAALFALSHLAVADKSDKTLRNQREAGKLLEELHAKNPEHPAGFHYLLHAYDNPTLANKAVDVARAYDKLAPSVPHALHMPTHIFTRMGMWDQSISWNVRSAEAALVESPENVTLSHYAHAVDYLVYAYLQKGDVTAASQALAEMNNIENHQNSFGTAYALAAASARVRLEQEDWKGAIRIPVNGSKGISWEKYPAMSAITQFARGLGAARSGDVTIAKEAISSLGDIHDKLEKSGQTYWATLVASQQKSVEAWLEFADGDREMALRLMLQAADIEDSVSKHPVTPGAVLPARELLGDMLSLMGRENEALSAYESALKISPNRARSLRGAQQAAAKIGQAERSKAYQDQLESQLKTAYTMEG